MEQLSSPSETFSKFLPDDLADIKLLPLDETRNSNSDHLFLSKSANIPASSYDLTEDGGYSEMDSFAGPSSQISSAAGMKWWTLNDDEGSRDAGFYEAEDDYDDDGDLLLLALGDNRRQQRSFW
jgi:hypothetical protein